VTAVLPAELASSPARTEALAPLLVGVANSVLNGLSANANTVVGNVHRRLAFSASPRIAGKPAHIGALIGQATTPDLAVRASVGVGESLIGRLRFETAASRSITSAVSGARELEFTDLALAVSKTVLGSGFYSLPPTAQRPPLTLTRETLLEA